MRRATIVLQNTDHSFCRYITAREAEEMVLKHRAVRASSRKKKQQNRVIYRLLPEVEPLRSMDQASPPSITSTEMQAFAGIGSPGQIRRARVKVAEFGRSRLTVAFA